MKINDLSKIEIGDFISTSTGSKKVWWKVVEKHIFGVSIQEHDGYAISYVDICFITKHKKED